MTLSKTSVGIPLAGLLLIGAAGAVAATTGEPASDATITVAAPSASPSPSSGTTVTPDPKDTVLTDVLDDLVAKGTITVDQQAAIEDAVVAERTARREARVAAREQLRTFLADGVITQEEFDQLPEDSRLRTAITLMDDGKITTEELRSLGGGPGPGLGLGRGGHGRGHGLDGPMDDDATDDDATATPTPGAGTSG